MQGSGKGKTSPKRAPSLDKRLLNWSVPTVLLRFPCQRCLLATPEQPTCRGLALPSLVAGPCPAPQGCSRPSCSHPSPPGLFIDLL